MEVYLDNSATTKLDPRVFEAMKPYFDSKYGNASSIHKMGQENNIKMIQCKEEIAKLIGGDPDCIIFTGSATEANNMIIKGVAKKNEDKGKHILISSIEHPSVKKSAEYLKKYGFEIEFIPVNSDGIVELDKIKKMIRSDTILISVMTVNNEIGTIQPIEKIATFAKKNGILFHTDAVQAVPYINFNVKAWGIDFLSLSAHKFNGPLGIGIAYLADKRSITPLIHGGGQEYNVRGGTYNIPGIVGVTEALKLAYTEKEDAIKNVSELTQYLWKRIQDEIDDVSLNGSSEHRTSNNLNILFRRIEGEAILMDLSVKGIYVSTGSACSAENLRASSVLSEIGLKDNDLNSNIRFTLSKFNTKEEIDYTVDSLVDTVKRLRSFTPIK
ncbi:cysteine desulfurase [Candidatus Peregrinibacteria bacterium]|nr:cysteine desulfurase [Candidatus Peregrinibacteria bacterium]